MSFPHRETPSISGRQLTRLLHRWADAHRLDPRRAETIRLAARAAPVDLGFDWWWRLLDPDNGSVFRATATRSAFPGKSGLAVEPPFGMDTPGFTGWASDDGEYQPYLRLS